MSSSSSRETDLIHLERTAVLADEAVEEGNHPFGALLVDGESGKVLAEAKNSYKVDKGPGHAESNLAREAARRFSEDTLRKSTLYTSVEPCTMCSGTIYWAGIGNVVYGMSEERLATLTGDDSENPTQNLECRIVFAAGRNTVQVRGPFPEVEERIVKQHLAYWKGS
jgi:tRNA(Arg) A34 adenosine deaminase TadA